MSARDVSKGFMIIIFANFKIFTNVVNVEDGVEQKQMYTDTKEQETERHVLHFFFFPNCNVEICEDVSGGNSCALFAMVIKASSRQK